MVCESYKNVLILYKGASSMARERRDHVDHGISLEFHLLLSMKDVLQSFLEIH